MREKSKRHEPGSTVIWTFSNRRPRKQLKVPPSNFMLHSTTTQTSVLVISNLTIYPHNGFTVKFTCTQYEARRFCAREPKQQETTRKSPFSPTSPGATVGKLFHRWITGLSDAGFDIGVVSTNQSSDSITEKIKAAASSFQNVTPGIEYKCHNASGARTRYRHLSRAWNGCSGPLRPLETLPFNVYLGGTRLHRGYRRWITF